VKFVAAISEDGCLRVIDALAEQCVTLLSMLWYILSLTHRLVDCYASYFGSLTCVAWSPDGRFILVLSLVDAYIPAADVFFLRLADKTTS